MKILLVLVLVALVGATVFSLVRGIAAFLQASREDIDGGGDGSLRELQLKQNRMMRNRIMFQFLAIVVVAFLVLMGS